MVKPEPVSAESSTVNAVRATPAVIQKINEAVRRATATEPTRMVAHLRGLPRFSRDLREYRSLAADSPFPARLRHLQPELTDQHEQAGDALGQYFHMDLHVARLIHARRPERHVDIGSRIDGFIAHLLTFMPVTVFDIRPLQVPPDGLTFEQRNCTSLVGVETNSVQSLSCLHTIEHLGLGRYGDPIDPSSPDAALSEMDRVLAPGGRLYLAAPIGRERLMFNAHRIFDPSRIPSSLANLRLVSFAAVNDAGHLDLQNDPDHYANANYSCGIYEFTK